VPEPTLRAMVNHSKPPGDGERRSPKIAEIG
jgi:hypothetical protein